VKSRVIIERNTLEIIDVKEAKGSEHDFKVYKESIGSLVSNSIAIDGILDIQG
jgi:hypothetical protein